MTDEWWEPQDADLIWQQQCEDEARQFMKEDDRMDQFNEAMDKILAKGRKDGHDAVRR